MKTIANIDFPTQPDEFAKWKPQIRHVALHRKFLAVAVPRIEGTWKCFGVSAPGLDHHSEEAAWEYDGCEMPERIARAIFPRYDEIPYAS